jgi:hypothetical protein
VNPGSLPLGGIILIVVGLASAFIAAALILREREQKSPEDAAVKQPAISINEEDWPGPNAKETPQPPISASDKHLTDNAVISSPKSAEPRKIEPKQPISPDKMTYSIATICRDEISSAIVIRVGDQEYRSTEELRSSPDWNRVQYAANDLVEWLRGEQSPHKTTAPMHKRSRPDTYEAISNQAIKQPNNRASQSPPRMIDAINEILKRKTTEAASKYAICLYEGANGILRVYIGAESYDFEHVPDPEVRKLIQESVAEWEARA